MSLISDLERIERSYKSNPKKEEMLLEVCQRYMPTDRKNALTYICIVRWINKTWREFAQQNSLNTEAFKLWVKENNPDASAMMKW